MSHALDGLTGLAAGTVPFALRGLMGSCRVTVLGRDRLREVYQGPPCIGAIWHRHVLFYADFFRRSGFTIMVSRSRDGEIATRILRNLGFAAVRGSSSRGGREALYEMIDLARHGRTVVFVADGPRGPAREAKIGVAVAALRTGRRIQPVGCAMSRSVRLRSWDRTEVPLPGSRIVMCLPPPMAIREGASAEECERFRGQVQAAILAAEDEARAAL